jgi:excisionase family DNA binding protein
MREQFLTVSEAATILGLTPRAIERRLKLGIMQGERAGQRVWMIPRSEVERWRSLGRLRPGPRPQPRE